MNGAAAANINTPLAAVGATPSSRYRTFAPDTEMVTNVAPAGTTENPVAADNAGTAEHPRALDVYGAACVINGFPDVHACHTPPRSVLKHILFACAFASCGAAATASINGSAIMEARYFLSTIPLLIPSM